jgi:hypothetical protein
MAARPCLSTLFTPKQTILSFPFDHRNTSGVRTGIKVYFGFESTDKKKALRRRL